MLLRHLELDGFRNHRTTRLDLPPGLTVVTGRNGHGKTNLLEAVAWLALGRSFRGAPTEALIGADVPHAVIRADVERHDPTGRARATRLEVMFPRQGRTRMQVNRNPVRRVAELVGHLHVTVFAPDDLALVKGGPAGRRDVVDDLVGALSPVRAVLRGEVDKILRQRNSLLRQSGGRLDADASATLDVWDHQLAERGEQLAGARGEVIDQLGPAVRRWYGALVGGDADVVVTYEAPWRQAGLAETLVANRRDDLRRGVTLAGPHRDDVDLRLDGMSTRLHASQGEQRTMALAVRLAGHELVADHLGVSPVVLLDDVFSELDHHRATALTRCLPSAQTLLTTATGSIPAEVAPELELTVVDGAVA